MTRYRKGGRKGISLRFDPDILDAIDTLGRKINRNRTELLEDAASALLKAHGVKVGETVPVVKTTPRRATVSSPSKRARPT